MNVPERGPIGPKTAQAIAEIERSQFIYLQPDGTWTLQRPKAPEVRGPIDRPPCECILCQRRGGGS